MFYSCLIRNIPHPPHMHTHIHTYHTHTEEGQCSGYNYATNHYFVLFLLNDDIH